MVVTVMKIFFEKLQTRIVNYRDHKCFRNDRFRVDLLSELGQENIEQNEKGSQMPFINEDVKRQKQRNFCVSFLRKSKLEIFKRKLSVITIHFRKLLTAHS